MSVLLLGVLVGTGLGFAAGLFSFKVKSRWCPQCGAMTQPTPPGTKP